MKTYYECLPCFVTQTLATLRRSGANSDQYDNILRKVFCELATIDFEAPPPLTAGKIYRIIRDCVHVDDPYLIDKKRFNEFAFLLLPEMRNRISKSSDVFRDKVKLAIAANIIDFGKHDNLTEKDALACFDKALEKQIDTAAVASLKNALIEEDNILFLCDNSGEIVFDKFLIEEMPLGKLTCAVRGAPVINDATMEDAVAAGLTDIVKVITNGSDIPGTVLDDCSPIFCQTFRNADIIIAKGQGNFETLNLITDKRIFFLLQIKCPVLSRDTGYPVGEFLIKEVTPTNCGVI